MSELKILYQDDHMVAIDKPAGLLVHRSMIDRRETRFAMQMLRDQIGQHVYPIHRLDRPTSGVLLFALSSDIARILSQSLQAKAMEKSYYALVRGHTIDSEVIDYPLKEILDKTTDGKAQQDKAAQEAVTHYHTVARFELPYAVGRYQSVRYALVKLQPATGRKHQLRRHMAHIRHPILGDTTHGDGKQNAFFFDHFGLRQLMLRATTLTLPQPLTGDRITIDAGFDSAWLAVFEQLGYQHNRQ